MYTLTIVYSTALCVGECCDHYDKKHDKKHNRHDILFPQAKNCIVQCLKANIYSVHAS